MGRGFPGAGLVVRARDRLGSGGEPESALERANVRMLTLDTAVQGIIQAGIAGFLAVFLVRLGAPSALVGLVAALPSLGAALLSLPASRWVAGRTDPVRVVVVTRAFIRFSYLAIVIVPSVRLHLAARHGADGHARGRRHRTPSHRAASRRPANIDDRQCRGGPRDPPRRPIMGRSAAG